MYSLRYLYISNLLLLQLYIFCQTYGEQISRQLDTQTVRQIYLIKIFIHFRPYF